MLEGVRSQWGERVLYKGPSYCASYGELYVGLCFEGRQHEMRGNFCGVFEPTTSYTRCMHRDGSYDKFLRNKPRRRIRNEKCFHLLMAGQALASAAKSHILSVGVVEIRCARIKFMFPIKEGINYAPRAPYPQSRFMPTHIYTKL